MQVIAIDLVGPLPESDNGNQYMLVVVFPESDNENQYMLVVADYFTRWVEAFPIPNQEANTVAAKMLDEIFLRFAVPE